MRVTEFLVVLKPVKKCLPSAWNLVGSSLESQAKGLHLRDIGPIINNVVLLIESMYFRWII